MAFVDYADRRKSGLQEVTFATYPPSPGGDVLRFLRLAADLGLREARRRNPPAIIGDDRPVSRG